ncbi:hypothetical protein AVEN_42194-1 [Araneus ventricosus]|uniref:Uncharacterized protein n=1 Tax=Araneus ventricosus TaxID=182803 RepID=A0A4Y2B0Q9_ARAVE|nr:hypothetical protein AVEN_42194-1 [Araneus ventricosus]
MVPFLLPSGSAKDTHQFGYAFADGLSRPTPNGAGLRAVKEPTDTGSSQESAGMSEYTADKDGYKAVIRSNRPGTSDHACRCV